MNYIFAVFFTATIIAAAVCVKDPDKRVEVRGHFLSIFPLLLLACWGLNWGHQAWW